MYATTARMTKPTATSAVAATRCVSQTDATIVNAANSNARPASAEHDHGSDEHPDDPAEFLLEFVAEQLGSCPRHRDQRPEQRPCGLEQAAGRSPG